MLHRRTRTAFGCTMCVYMYILYKYILCRSLNKIIAISNGFFPPSYYNMCYPSRQTISLSFLLLCRISCHGAHGAHFIANHGNFIYTASINSFRLHDRKRKEQREWEREKQIPGAGSTIIVIRRSENRSRSIAAHKRLIVVYYVSCSTAKLIRVFSINVFVMFGKSNAMCNVIAIVVGVRSRWCCCQWAKIPECIPSHNIRAPSIPFIGQCD